MIPLKSFALSAITSSVGTATIFFSSAYANPFTTVMPIRSPVKEPGPTLMAKQSIFPILSFAFFTSLSMVGTSSIECFLSAFS